MRSFLFLTENGPLLAMTSSGNVTDVEFLDVLHGRGIDKFIAYEVPVERVHEFYGEPFEIIAADMESGADLRVVDFNGPNIFDTLSFSELGHQVHYEA